MTWDKLVDRCLLFTDAPGGLLKELLKEAQVELSNELELYDSMFQIEVPGTISGLGGQSSNADASHDYTPLPVDFIRDNFVTYDGKKLRKMSEEEIYRQTNLKTYNGTPTAYGISGDHLVFDYTPPVADKFLLHYKASLVPNHNRAKLVYILYYDNSGPFVYLDTELGEELKGTKCRFEGQVRTLSTYNSTGVGNMPVGLPDLWRKNALVTDPASWSGMPEYMGNKFTLNSTLSTEGSLQTSLGGVNNCIGGLLSLDTYGDKAPLIPSKFHKSLCDYAIALANAKQSPEKYQMHWSMWLGNMEKLRNEARDRDLIYSIREES